MIYRVRCVSALRKILWKYVSYGYWDLLLIFARYDECTDFPRLVSGYIPVYSCANSICYLYGCVFNLVVNSTKRGAEKNDIFRHILYSPSGKTSYRHISWSLEDTRLAVIIVVSPCNRSDRHLGSAVAGAGGGCQVSERSESFKPEPRGLETSRDVAVRHPSA